MSRRLFPAFVLLMAALAGCIEAQPDEPEDPAPPSDGAEAPAACTPPEVAPAGPTGGGQTSVSNEPGAFSYGGQVAAKTAKEVFLWENPSTAAQVAWGGQTGAGALKLTVQDHCGAQIYQREISAGTQSGVMETTTRGVGGTWILTLEFTLYTGQMGLSVTSA